MSSRMRSPSYPSTPLKEAVVLIEKIFRAERTNSVDREVAALAMGYRGISGRSAKVLANLNQYGLLERAGKNEVRVTQRAVEILHPDTLESHHLALREAAFEPELFQRIKERFPDGRPSEAALRSYFIKEGFTDAAIAPAMRAYFETYQYLEDMNVNESHGSSDVDMGESVPDQQGSQSEHMKHTPGVQTTSRKSNTSESAIGTGPDIRAHNRKIWLSGVIETSDQVDEAIQLLTALRGFVTESPKKICAPSESSMKDPVEGSDLV